jgi:hypothetical protein
VDIESPQWEEYETRFRALAEQLSMHKGPDPNLPKAKIHLCLYGENGLTPEQEFALLDRLEQQAAQIRGVEIQTSYWEDLVLFLP